MEGYEHHACPDVPGAGDKCGNGSGRSLEKSHSMAWNGPATVVGASAGASAHGRQSKICQQFRRANASKFWPQPGLCSISTHPRQFNPVPANFEGGTPLLVVWSTLRQDGQRNCILTFWVHALHVVRVQTLKP